MFPKRIALTLTLAAVCSSPASAQEETQGAQSGGIDFSINSSFEYQTEADLENSADLEVTRYHFGVGASMDLSRDVELSLRFAYDLDSFDFDRPIVRFDNAENPWEDIHTLSFGAIFAAKMTNNISVFGGPVAQVSREEGADWDDAWIAGGVAGVSYRVSKDLVIGGGFGLVSQLQDEARFFPVLILDWHINDRLRLSNQTATSAGGGSGIELIYKFSEQWEAAAGVRWEFRRFRLDDEGVAPDGVGEESRLPIHARLTYKLNDNFNITVRGGFVPTEELKMETAAGSGFGQLDADTAAIIGFSVGVRF